VKYRSVNICSVVGLSADANGIVLLLMLFILRVFRDRFGTE